MASLYRAILNAMIYKLFCEIAMFLENEKLVPKKSVVF
jgi:hypothetical protein